MKELVEILGFLGALRNYGYIDRLGNAVDEVTVEEAIRDAIRAYLSQCGENPEACVEINENVGVKCVQLDPSALERSVGALLARIRQSKVELLKTSRSIALEAYAAIPRIRENQKCTPKR
ncbi:MAG: hypothetical protein QW123_04950 [Desulfurococcaceae archaeon]